MITQLVKKFPQRNVSTRLKDNSVGTAIKEASE
jgi:hypothetical protein